MTVIVPLDFSAQSINAASFAAQMLTGTYGAELLLYHLYVDEKEEATVIENLQKVKHALTNNSITKIRLLAEKGVGLIQTLAQLAKKEDASLVVMSVSDRVKFFEDSYSLQMMNESDCPVLVIPYGYMFNDVRRVALASDFKEVTKTIPLAKVKKILNIFRAQLHIVHVNPGIYISLNEELLSQRQRLDEMFSEFAPEFHFITTNDFSESLAQFIDDKNIDLVLTFPRKHHYLSTLIKGTNTQKLVYRNTVPVLAAHD
ncbi:MAG: universal stress protein [Chitinophagaceae bacterium]|nr:MAG: universal stress protein [Chitinophagaceae bacterium]